MIINIIINIMAVFVWNYILSIDNSVGRAYKLLDGKETHFGDRPIISKWPNIIQFEHLSSNLST